MGMSNGLQIETEHLPTTATSTLQTEAALYYGTKSNKSHLNLAPINHKQAQNHSSCYCTVTNLISAVFDDFNKVSQCISYFQRN